MRLIFWGLMEKIMLDGDFTLPAFLCSTRFFFLAPERHPEFLSKLGIEGARLF